MANRRILLLVHPTFRPDTSRVQPGTEQDVWRGLKRLGYAVEVCAEVTDLRALDKELGRFRPDIVFNLLEEFRGEAVFDFHATAYLEARDIPYTGCNPRGLILSRNKFITAQIARAVECRTPRTVIWNHRKSELKDFEFPLFVKLNREHASLGITSQNRVATHQALAKVCRRLDAHHAGEILIQEFVAGREISISIWGNRSCQTLDPWELRLPSEIHFSTQRLKFNSAYRRRHRIRTCRFVGPAAASMKSAARRVYGALEMSGYARIDFRLDPSGRPFLIDVNANPNLAHDEDFAQSAKALGYSYLDVLNRILDLGLKYRPRL